MWGYFILGVIVLVLISMFFSYIIVPILCCFLGDFVFALYIFYDKIGPFVRSFTDNGVSFTIFCIIVVIIIFVANYFLLIFIATISVKLAWIYNFAIVCIMSYSGFKFGVDQAFKEDISIFEIHYTTLPILNFIITSIFLLILIIIGFSIRVRFFIGGESPIDYFLGISSEADFDKEIVISNNRKVTIRMLDEDDFDYEMKKDKVDKIKNTYLYAKDNNISDLKNQLLTNAEEYKKANLYAQSYLEEFLRFWQTNDLAEGNHLLEHNLNLLVEKISNQKKILMVNIRHLDDDEFYEELDRYEKLVEQFIIYKKQSDEIFFCVEFLERK